MNFWTFLFVPTIVFMSLVAPIWIVMHYRAKNKERAGISEDERQTLDELLETIDNLHNRIDTLEEILNEDHPSWKDSVKGDK